MSDLSGAALLDEILEAGKAKEPPPKDEVFRALQACKDLKTCTIDDICAPLIGRSQQSLLDMSGKREQLALAQVVYYSQEIAELSRKHTNEQTAFTRLLDTIMRMPVKKPKKKEEDANDGARRTRLQTATAG